MAKHGIAQNSLHEYQWSDYRKLWNNFTQFVSGKLTGPYISVRVEAVLYFVVQIKSYFYTKI